MQPPVNCHFLIWVAQLLTGVEMTARPLQGCENFKGARAFIEKSSCTLSLLPKHEAAMLFSFLPTRLFLSAFAAAKKLGDAIADAVKFVATRQRPSPRICFRNSDRWDSVKKTAQTRPISLEVRCPNTIFLRQNTSPRLLCA